MCIIVHELQSLHCLDAHCAHRALSSGAPLEHTVHTVHPCSTLCTLCILCTPARCAPLSTLCTLCTLWTHCAHCAHCAPMSTLCTLCTLHPQETKCAQVYTIKDPLHTSAHCANLTVAGWGCARCAQPASTPPEPSSTRVQAGRQGTFTEIWGYKSRL
jgi:hypothetical protein